MEQSYLQAGTEALRAIKRMVGDQLLTHRPTRAQLRCLTRLDLAYELRLLGHAQVCHYLRCDATRGELLLVREAIEDALRLLTEGDQELARELRVVEPYRHVLYTWMTVAALRASERACVRREMAYWRQRPAAAVMTPRLTSSLSPEATRATGRRCRLKVNGSSALRSSR